MSDKCKISSFLSMVSFLIPIIFYIHAGDKCPMPGKRVPVLNI
jgi:hypothetical protein